MPIGRSNLPSDEPIIVVGAGPTGLSLALSLGLEGFPVILLEAENELHRQSRGAAYHPPTLEIFDKLGVGEKILSLGLQAPSWQIWDRTEGLVAEFDLDLLRDHTQFPFRLHLEQGRLARVLLDRLVAAAPTVQVRFGCRIVAADQDDHGAWVVLANGETVHGSFVVGCEGARSVVRQSARLDFEGFTWPERFLVTVSALDLSRYGLANAGYVSDPERWAAFFHLPGNGPPGVWRVVYPVPEQMEEAEALDRSRVESTLRSILEPMGVEFPKGRYPLIESSIYRVHQRVAAQFFAGRMIIAGDAAHLNNPLGGFGLNGGVQDAANLAEKLTRIVGQGADHPPLLDLYQRQRRPINIKAVQTLSIRNKRMLEERDPKVRRERLNELRATAQEPDRARAYLLNTSMINTMREAATIL